MKQNGDISTYINFEVGLTCVMFLTVPFMMFIAFDKSPACIAYMDRHRSTAMRPIGDQIEKEENKDEMSTLKSLPE